MADIRFLEKQRERRETATLTDYLACKSKLEKCERELKDPKFASAKSLQEKVRKLTAENNKFQNDLAARTVELSKKNRELFLAEQRIQALEASKKPAAVAPSPEIEKLIAENADLKKKSDGLESANARLSDELAKLKDDIKALETEKRSIEEDLRRASSAKIEDFVEKLQKCEFDLEQGKAKSAEELKKAGDKFDECQAAMNKQEERIKELNVLLDEYDKLATSSEEDKDKNERIAELTVKVSDCEQKLFLEMERMHKINREDFDSREKALRECIAGHEQCATKLRECYAKMESMNAEFAQKDGDLKSAKREIARLRASESDRNRARDAEKQKVLDELDAERTKRMAAVAEAESQKKEYESYKRLTAIHQEGVAAREKKKDVGCDDAYRRLSIKSEGFRRTIDERDADISLRDRDMAEMARRVASAELKSKSLASVMNDTLMYRNVEQQELGMLSQKIRNLELALEKKKMIIVV